MSRSSTMSTASATLQVHWPSSSSQSTPVQRSTFHGLTSTDTSTTAPQDQHHHQNCLPLLPERRPEPPLLLLQGDELHVSPEGIARSCYHLANDNNIAHDQWTIEEQYHLDNCTKSFVIRCPLPVSSPFLQQQQQSTTIQLQEVDTRLAGTGGTTWEASMAMALYFARNTQNLQGRHHNVVEIGCGVGLGGMLLHHVLSTQQQLSSITLTDGCPQVVEQCRDNVERYLQEHQQGQGAATQVQVKQLDWNDVLQQQQQSSKTVNDKQPFVQQKYNTVIACDCAYRHQDVHGLTETLKALLKRDDEHDDSNNKNNNRIHLFGPYNRVAYQDVIERMQHDKDIEVQVEWMELCRYRLAAPDSPHSNNIYHQDATCVAQFPSAQHNSKRFSSSQHHTNINDLQQLEEELQDANKSSAKFLHVVAKWKKQKSSHKAGAEDQQSSSLSEID